MNYIVLAVFVSSVTFAISSPMNLLSLDEFRSNSSIKSGKFDRKIANENFNLLLFCFI